MSITLKDVEYVAELAKLELSPEEKIRFQRELDKVIGYVDQLKELDTESVPVTSHVVPRRNVMREDEILSPLPPDQALGNAPRSEDGFFRVPKVIG